MEYNQKSSASKKKTFSARFNAKMTLPLMFRVFSAARDHRLNR